MTAGVVLLFTVVWCVIVWLDYRISNLEAQR